MEVGNTGPDIDFYKLTSSVVKNTPCVTTLLGVHCHTRLPLVWPFCGLIASVLFVSKKILNSAQLCRHLFFSNSYVQTKKKKKLWKASIFFIIYILIDFIIDWVVEHSLYPLAWSVLHFQLWTEVHFRPLLGKKLPPTFIYKILFQSFNYILFLFKILYLILGRNKLYQWILTPPVIDLLNIEF